MENTLPPELEESPLAPILGCLRGTVWREKPRAMSDAFPNRCTAKIWVVIADDVDLATTSPQAKLTIWQYFVNRPELFDEIAVEVSICRRLNFTRSVTRVSCVLRAAEHDPITGTEKMPPHRQLQFAPLGNAFRTSPTVLAHGNLICQFHHMRRLQSSEVQY